MGQRILIVDDNSVVAHGLSVLLNDGHRIVFSARDIASAELVLENEDVDLVLSDVRLTGDFSYEGLDFLDHIRNFSPDVQVLLMTGAGDPELEGEAHRRGALGLLKKPFDLHDLEPFLVQGTAGEGSIQLLPTLDEIMLPEKLSNAFQPIFRIGEPTPVEIGREALARAATPTLFRNPEFLFRYANKMRRVHELENYCTEASLRSWFTSGLPGLLFINVNPETISSRGFAKRVVSFATGEIDLTRVVFEITEQGPLDCAGATATVERLREHGAQIAFDDVGVAFSHLPCLESIKPDWMKVSQVFGTDFEKSATRRMIVSNIARLAIDTGAKLILEGIETRETLEAARDLGIEYGQGFHLGYPGPLG